MTYLDRSCGRYVVVKGRLKGLIRWVAYLRP